MKSWISLGMSSAQWLSLWLWSVPACSGRRWALPTATSGQDRAAFFISSHFNSFLLPRGGSERIDSSSYPRASLKHTLLCQFGPVCGAGCPIRHQRLRYFLLAVTCWPVVRSGRLLADMPEYLGDPSVLTKEKLKSELLAHNVELPSGNPTKDVYVQLYLTKLAGQSTRPAAADSFSSDEELPLPALPDTSRSSSRVSALPLPSHLHTSTPTRITQPPKSTFWTRRLLTTVNVRSIVSDVQNTSAWNVASSDSAHIETCALLTDITGNVIPIESIRQSREWIAE